jgi:DNA-binding NtrC family response regulator
MAKTRPAPEAPHVRLRRVEVAVAGGGKKGISIPLAEGPLVIGTDPSCNLVLDDDTVSAIHCELAMDGSRVTLRDLDSTNGTFIEDVRVREAYPVPGTRIRVGRTKLTIREAGEEEVAASEGERLEGLYGTSPAMRALFAQLQRIAASPAPLLIEGETGTGKDLTAETVHRLSSRAEGPFVIFDCGSVSGGLLEAELFGNERGAFTGALSSREGLAESAHGGTLVIDEIGDLPLELQPKLLRLVERREIRRVGGNDPIVIDVRIIACTHHSLRENVKRGTFREDLYFRLSGFRVRVPSLRERLEDLPGLVDLLLAERGSSKRFRDLPGNDRALLLSHRWPGNVRELRNVVERLLAFAPDAPYRLIEEPGRVTEPAVPTNPGTFDAPLVPLSQARERVHQDFERRYLTDVMRRANGTISEAARLAGVPRQFLQRLLRRHGMR